MKEDAQTPEIYIIFSADINNYSIGELADILYTKLPDNTKTVHLLISTCGGFVSSGIALYNLLLALPYKLITHNISNIDSIGNLIFSAGEKRYAVAGASFLIHKIQCRPEETKFDISFLKEKLSCAELDEERVNKYIMERTRLKQKDLHDLYQTGESKDVNYALSKGIIHAIQEVSIPAGAKVFVVKCGAQPTGQE